MSSIREGDTIRVLSGDDEGRIGEALVVRDDGSVVIYLPPNPNQPDIWWGETVHFEEGLEVMERDTADAPNVPH